MAIFKCKMCGGALEINNNETVFDCEYCGTKQTLPKLDDDRKANLYDRANHFRRNNEFDKAMGIYEQILNDDNTDAESYWSLVLCRYGIEYVEDPATHKRVPTVNRAQFTSIFDDEDYKSALQYADGVQKSVYEDEAKAINEIQKGILAISQKEEPFDVFICYKETDTDGRRTQDSVIATELYHELTREGYKVFFSRITLEDKLGTAYEPYIFAALNSAKVMVVLGTKAEYFNAVWIKNEWSRYLSLIKNGAKKILIPAYRDMDPYDLPEEFSHLQAQDMSKLGFMQDLIRGINKLVKTEEQKPTVVKETVVTESANGNVVSLLKRGFMALEDKEWRKADDFFEQSLNFDAELAEAYLGKLMAELRVSKQDDLKNCKEPFASNPNYLKVVRFGDDKLKQEIQEYIRIIEERNEAERIERIYQNGCNLMTKNQPAMYLKAAEIFGSIVDYKDSAIKQSECKEKAESTRKDIIYDKAKTLMRKKDIPSYEKAIVKFESISGWRDSIELAAQCKRSIEEINIKKEQERLEAIRKAEAEKAEKERAAKERKKKIKKISIISAAAICIVVALTMLINFVVLPEIKYNKAIALMDEGNLDEAYDIFSELDDYKDVTNKAIDIIKKQLKNIKIGDYIKFGTYEQDNNKLNGKEDIEWLVLEVKDGKALVISKYALDKKPYNTNRADVTWETCTLRKWLNNDFIYSAFSAEAQTIIPTVTVSADKNPEYNTNPGNDTQDKVFLLSIEEVNDYFTSDNERQLNIRSWWLRTPGGMQDYASYVSGLNGSITYYGVWADYLTHMCVRPAMWINFE